MIIFSAPKAFKRAIFFAFVSHLFFNAAFAQVTSSKGKENFDICKFRVISIDIPASSNSLILLKNFSGIKIIDGRADTSAVGFMQKKIYALSSRFSGNKGWHQADPTANRTPTFVRTRNGFDKDAKLFAGSQLVFNPNESLPSILMVVKRLWLSDELNVNDNLHAVERLKDTGNQETGTSGIDVQIEFFMNDKDSYYPMYRFDTLIGKRKIVAAYAREYLTQALNASMQKLRIMDEKIVVLKAKRSFSLQEIANHLQNEFNMPVLTGSLLNKGVYMTFDEFKNNNASQRDFEVKNDKLTDVIYIKQADGSEFAARNTWGYSDGTNAFVKSVNNFFILQRSQNAFYIYGAKSIIIDEYQSAGSAGYNMNGEGVVLPVTFIRSNTAIQLEPFQLDWNTGKLY